MINLPQGVRGPVNLVLRLVAAAGLAVDAYVHFDLAADFDALGGAIIPLGALFRVQAVIALVAAVLVLLLGRTWVYLAVFFIAASALGAVLQSTYVDIGSLGPLPSMYEPVWYWDKAFSAIGEAVAAVAAVGLLALTVRRRAPAEPAEPAEPVLAH